MLSRKPYDDDVGGKMVGMMSDDGVDAALLVMLRRLSADGYLIWM